MEDHKKLPDLLLGKSSWDSTALHLLTTYEDANLQFNEEEV